MIEDYVIYNNIINSTESSSINMQGTEIDQQIVLDEMVRIVRVPIAST